MKKVLITPASFDVFTVAEIKARPELRITGSTDDAVIADLIDSAVEAYEEFTDNVLRLSIWDIFFNGFPKKNGDIETPGPLASVSSVSYLDSETSPSSMTTMDSSRYIIDGKDPMAGRISLIHGQSWETPVQQQINNVCVRAGIGYEDAESIPRRIKDGLLLKIQEIYYGGNLSAAYEACWVAFKRQAL